MSGQKRLHRGGIVTGLNGIRYRVLRSQSERASYVAKLEIEVDEGDPPAVRGLQSVGHAGSQHGFPTAAFGRADRDETRSTGLGFHQVDIYGVARSTADAVHSVPQCSENVARVCVGRQ